MHAERFRVDVMPLRRLIFQVLIRLQLARRIGHRFPRITAYLPWRWWCLVCGYSAQAVVEGIAARCSPLTFLQVGANDGVAGDPLQQVVRTYGWRGACVEPVPQVFERLRASYADVPGVSCIRAAIAAADGSVSLYRVDPRPGDPLWVDQIASLDKEVLLRHEDQVPGLADRVVEVDVPAHTLPSLVRAAALEHIDLLHTDVEGYDLEVVNQIDFGAAWAPSYLIFELRHLDRGAAREAARMLRTRGYRLLTVWPDRFAYRENPPPLRHRRATTRRRA
jgi:FkbM family methyltransferase